MMLKPLSRLFCRMQGINRLECFQSSTFLLLYIIMACYGELSQTSQTCPNSALMICCNITTTGPVTTWVVPPGHCPSNSIILSQPPGTDCGSKNDSCGPFVATNLVPPSGQACTTSVLSVVASPQLNGTNISCYSSGILQYQQIISITIAPGLPLVTVSPMINGLVVSCTPGSNGDPPTSYDITVEPNGTHIIAGSNGLVEQNIPGLLPNTTYTVRVIAINCAGASGVVAVNATTANDTTQAPLSSLATIGLGVRIGVGVGVPLIMVIAAAAAAAVFIMLYRISRTAKHALPPLCMLTTSSISEQSREALDQTFIIVCADAGNSDEVFEVESIAFVNLKTKNQPPSDDQLWYKNQQDDGSFAIVSKRNGRALKLDPASSQVIFSNTSQGDLWRVEGSYIVHQESSELMYFNHKKILYCAKRESKELTKGRKAFTFQEMMGTASEMSPNMAYGTSTSVHEAKTDVLGQCRDIAFHHM